MRFRAAMNLEVHQRAVVSDYREFPVPTHLADYFLCFWTQAFVGVREYAHSPISPFDPLKARRRLDTDEDAR